ncbi:MAG: hypothetical protein ACTHMY_04745 [Solirubrobacteraceae bacterium]
MSTFEDRLWSQLVREHGDQMQLPTIAARPHRRRPALITASALATAVVVAAVLVLTATTSTPAYAVTDNSDGTVTVTLHDIQAITALNAALARDGIAARAIPLTADCPIHGFPNPMPAGTNPSTYTITIVPADIPDGYTAIVAASQNSSGEVQLAQGAWPSPGPPCLNSAPLLVPRKR